METEIPGLRIAVTMDLGDNLKVHPRNKKEVEWRLALLALSETYGFQPLGFVIGRSGREYG